MSAHYNNIIAIKGTKKDVLKFIADGMKKEVELDCDTFTNLTLRSWIPGEDSYQSNIKDLGVKYDSEFIEWECIKDDENDTVICCHINTTPGFPCDWLAKVIDLYSDLYFYYYSVDEDYSEGICAEDIINKYTICFTSFICLANHEKLELVDITRNQFYKYIAL